jgi:hypothetical protein
MTWHTWIGQHLADLRELWPDLLEARFYPQAVSLTAALPMTEEEKDYANTEARKDRLAAFYSVRDHGVEPPGRTPSPAPETVLDAIATITNSLLVMADEIAGYLGTTHPSFRSGEPGVGRGYDDDDQPDGRAHWASLWIEDALTGINDEALGERILTQAQRMVQTCNIALGNGDHRIRLDARCPYCEGEALFLYPSTRNEESEVRCLSGQVCDPPIEQCASRLKGRPLWRWNEFERLNKAIERHAKEKAA